MTRNFQFILTLAILMSCESSQDRRDRFFSKGNQALANEQYEKAVQLYTESIKADPSYPKALNNRGVAHMELGHPHEAILDYNKAISIRNSYLDALFNRAYAYEEINQLDNALQDVAQINKMKPDSAFVYFYKGLVLTKYRKYSEAYSNFLIADSLNPYNPQTIVNMATVIFFLNKLDSAKNLLEQALMLNPEDANATNLESLIALKNGDYETALTKINVSLEAVPNEPFFLNNRGYVYLEMDSLELAIEDINRSIVLNPNNGWAYRNKGIYHLRKKNYPKARNLFERALRTNDFIDEIYHYLGTTYFLEGNRKKACEIWSQGKSEMEVESENLFRQNCL